MRERQIHRQKQRQIQKQKHEKEKEKEREERGREQFPQLDESTLQHDDGVTTITAFIYAAFT